MARTTQPPSLVARLVNLVVAIIWALGGIPLFLVRLVWRGAGPLVAFLLTKPTAPARKVQPPRKPLPAADSFGLRAMALTASVLAVGLLAWRPDPPGPIFGDVVVRRLPKPRPVGPHDGADPFSKLPPVPAWRPPPIPEPGPQPEPQPGPTPGPAPQPVADCANIASPQPMRYHWTDYSASGGLFGGGATLDMAATLDRAAVQRAIDGFGLPDGLLELYSRPGGPERLLARGIAIEGHTIQVAYAEMVRRGHYELRCLAAELDKVVQAYAGGDGRKRLGALASFVQGGQNCHGRCAIEYPPMDANGQPIPLKRPLSNGTEVETLGFRVPLETLALAQGDCDSKSTLFAALLAALDGPRTLLCSGEGHQFGGVEVAGVQRGDMYFEFEGTAFLLIELTAGMPIGQIGANSYGFLRRGALRVQVPWRNGDG